VKQYESQDEKFMSGAEKQLVLKAWVTFLKHGCRSEHFTERLYDHLSLHCSFIAHFDRHGFYEFYFSHPSERTYRFLDQFDPCKPGIAAELGAMYWLMDRATGSDLNHAMREVAGTYIAKLRYQFSETEKHSDLALASVLAAKYGKRLSDGESSARPEVSSWVSADAGDSENSRAEQLSIFFSTG
jgi:hypothetical protein